MAMPKKRYLFFTKVARKDIDDTVDWYETQQLGLGIGFKDAGKATSHLIASNPVIGAPRHKTVRRILVEKFPYAIYYRTFKTVNKISVIGILHARRHPRVWRSRV